MHIPFDKWQKKIIRRNFESSLGNDGDGQTNLSTNQPPTPSSLYIFSQSHFYPNWYLQANKQAHTLYICRSLTSIRWWRRNETTIIVHYIIITANHYNVSFTLRTSFFRFLDVPNKNEWHIKTENSAPHPGYSSS